MTSLASLATSGFQSPARPLRPLIFSAPSPRGNWVLLQQLLQLLLLLPPLIWSPSLLLAINLLVAILHAWNTVTPSCALITFWRGLQNWWDQSSVVLTEFVEPTLQDSGQKLSVTGGCPAQIAPRPSSSRIVSTRSCLVVLAWTSLLFSTLRPRIGPPLETAFQSPQLSATVSRARQRLVPTWRCRRH